MSFPGAFPTIQVARLRNQSAPDLNPDSSLRESDFVSKTELTSKVESQRVLITTLSATTYFFIGYQFLRYTHSACLPPSLAHIFIQFLLQTWRASTHSEVDLFGEHLDMQQQLHQIQLLPFDRLAAARKLLKQTCLLIYLKFFAVVVYHLLFFVYWLRPAALLGQLEGLEHGSWYGVSFIGESISIDIQESDWFLLQLWKLELGQVLLLNLVILVLQLTLYQCVFVQSTLSPNGIRVGEPEAFILRGTPGVPATKTTHPDLIQIRLYEAFQRDSFSLQSDS